MPDHIEDMPLRRTDDGYFEEDTPGGAERDDSDRRAIDDDPDSVAKHPPGTVDDLPYDLGEETAEPIDMHVGRTPAEVRELRTETPGGDSDVWREQQDLVSIDEKAGYNVEDFSEEQRDGISRALGDDAAESYQEAPGGTSATGSSSGEEHGGFPEES